MRKLLTTISLIFIVSCGPKEGDIYQFKDMKQKVTVSMTGEFEQLANTIRSIKEGADTLSIDREVILNKDLQKQIKENKGKDAVVVKWKDKRYNDLYNEWNKYFHYRVLTEKDFKVIFTKVKH
jgi:imidazole glycerol phosphate synthase subunit HisF